MEVYLTKNGKKSGPFIPHQVRTKLDRGTITADEFVWFEGLTEPISASAIASRIEFRKATPEQKDAIRFLGHRIDRNLMYLEAEAFIERTAAAENKVEALSEWKANTLKMEVVREWWRNQSEFGLPGGIIALEEELTNIQHSDPRLFVTITPQQLIKRLPYFIIDGWRRDPATKAQINLLSQHGVRVPYGLTKGAASDQIGGIVNQVTEGQRRRLIFYGLAVPGTKDEASAMIDAYMTENPAVEECYQTWKREENLQNEPAAFALDPTRAVVFAAFLLLAICAVAYFATKPFEHSTRSISAPRAALTPTPQERPRILAPNVAASNAASDEWTPPPTEFVQLTAPVSLVNSRGKEVKQLPTGKRLRVTKRSDGNQITVNYLGTDYTIPVVSTQSSK
jgi:hypothetical protein